MYHGSKSKPQQWGSWSDWGWDEKHKSYYRVRQDAEAHAQVPGAGNLDYDWDTREESATAVHAQTPRDSTIESVTEQFENLSTEPFAKIPENYTEKSRSSKSKSKPKPRPGSSSKNADIDGYRYSSTDAPQQSHSSRDDCEDETSQYIHGSSASNYYQGPEPEPHFTSRASFDAGRRSRSHSTKGSTARHNNQKIPSHDHEEELANTIAATQSYTYNPYDNMGESSTAPPAAAYAPYDETEDEGPPTPKAQESRDAYHIAAFEESLEELDPRYRVEPSSRFQPGEIFKVHWSEPQGSGNDGAPSVSGKHEIQNRFGTKFFVGFRRFIVIANDQGHCTCVPILTYGGKACKKKGVKADKHGIIHERGHKARLLEKEPTLGFKPVRVEMKEDGEKLSKESRVNYSKLVTVEHNVKVFFIGSVVYNDWDLVRDAVNQCWNKKNHQKQRHR